MNEQDNPAVPERICPLCGRPNGCGAAATKEHGACWCAGERFPQEIFAEIPRDRIGKACICRSCLEAFKAGARCPEA